jgi:cellulose synthase/poly-beta-1,6-N-acetylglucosamine synthase-like glycosyltransferase
MEVIYDILGYSVLIIYCLILTYISLYCFLQFHLLYKYRKAKREGQNETNPPLKSDNDLSRYPFVTIQLPIFNERYVIQRLLKNISQLDYPKERMEIQVLDDSTDDTVEITAKEISSMRQKGYQIEHLHRSNRQGYKAGALKDAMPYARGEYIAIFDADFLPKPDFLMATLPHFQDPKVGIVQTRWEHINQDYSLITKLQAFQLNVHFTVEQTGREYGDYMLQFNGTAGVWRREAIEDAGGWEADTLTEDLDLSYRAQLKGWKVSYLEEMGSPAELPAEMNGLKSQQYRWMKGGAETAKKLLPVVWKSPLSLSKKMHATGHLMASTIFLFVFLAALLSVPVLIFMDYKMMDPTFLQVFLLSMLSIIAVYFTANVSSPSIGWGTNFKNIRRFALIFPMFLSLSMGLSLHNAMAVMHGYLGKKTAFIRTPKFNIQRLDDSFKGRLYLSRHLSFSTIVEILMAAYFGFAIIYALLQGYGAFLIFHLLLVIGFSAIAYYSIKHLNAK